MSSMEDRKTFLVTGGAGFIGSHVVDGLIEQGQRVLVVDDLSSGRKENVHEEAELHVVDVRYPEAFELAALEGVDVLIHHAAQMDVRRSTADPEFDAEVNILGTLNMLQAAVKGKVKQVIFASTGGAIYGEQEVFPAGEGHPQRPLSPYGVSKLAGERYLYYFHQEHGMDVTCLRYANVYGERQNPHGEAGVVAIFLSRLLSGDNCAINGDGLQTRDYIHVSDVVHANLAAIGQPGFRTYNVGTGTETSVVDLYQLLAKTVGTDREPLHGPGMPGEQRRSSIDARLIRRELGVAEPLDLEQGLERTAGWFKERVDE
jgi:UDP-glucose 4-epimerase